MRRKMILPVLTALMPILAYAQSNVDIDFDDNGVVDFRDFLALVQAFGSDQEPYDLHPDGVVDFKDFLIFRRGLWSARHVCGRPGYRAGR